MRRLTDLSDLLTGHKVDIEEFSYRPGLNYLLNSSDVEVRFNREYVRTTRSEKVIDHVYTSFELHKSESEAISLIQHYEQLEPSNLFRLIFSDATDRFWSTEIFAFADAERLEIPGGGIMGLADGYYHLYFLAHGRMTGYILVTGVVSLWKEGNLGYLEVEKTMPLAAEIYARVTEVE